MSSSEKVSAEKTEGETLADLRCFVTGRITVEEITWNQGYGAQLNGAKLDDNPYLPDRTYLADMWALGWRAADIGLPPHMPKSSR